MIEFTKGFAFTFGIFIILLICFLGLGFELGSLLGVVYIWPLLIAVFIICLLGGLSYAGLI